MEDGYTGPVNIKTDFTQANLQAKYRQRAYEVSNVVMGGVLVATFISAFFFLYVSHVENEIVKSQMERIVTEILTPISLLTPESERLRLKAELDQVDIPTAEDAVVAKKNHKIVVMALAIFGSVIAVGTAIILGLRWRYKYDLKKVSKFNAIIMVPVAITYFLFVTFVIRAYFLIDTNFVKYLVLKQIMATQQGLTVEQQLKAQGNLPGQ